MINLLVNFYIALFLSELFLFWKFIYLSVIDINDTFFLLSLFAQIRHHIWIVIAESLSGNSKLLPHSIKIKIHYFSVVSKK